MMNNKYQKQPFTFETTNARILEIRKIDDDPVMRTLVAEFYSGHFPEQYRGKVIEKQAAIDEWNRDPLVGNGSFARYTDDNGDGDGGALGEMEDEMPDVEAFLGSVMLDEVRDYAALKQDMYKRHKRAAQLKASVVVEYVPSGGVVKRNALVYGSWPSLSCVLPLVIRGKLMTDAGGDPNFDIVDARAGEIRIGRVEQVSGRAFFTLLNENGGFSAADAKSYLAKIYGGAAASSASVLSLQIRGPPNIRAITNDRELAALQREAQREQLHQIEKRLADAVLPLADLIEQIHNSMPAALWNKMLMAPFIALGLRATLLNKELMLIHDYYSGAVQLETLIRGNRLITNVAQILQSTPEVLCLPKLRRDYGKEHSIHGLSLLPDLEFDKFIQLEDMLKRDATGAIPVAIDIYHNILRRDVYGYKNWWDGRVSSGSEICYTSGHMFTVLGCSLDDFEQQYYHDPNKPAEKDLRDPSSLSTHGRFCLPWDSCHIPIDEVDFVAMARSMTNECRQALSNDYSRLKRDSSRNLIALLRGLYWLVQNKVIVPERFIGTAPINKGLPVDALFLADIYESQCKLVECLKSIVDNSNAQKQMRSSTMANPRAIAVREMAIQFEHKWRRFYSSATRRPVSELDFENANAWEQRQDLRDMIGNDDDSEEDSEQKQEVEEEEKHTMFSLARMIARDTEALELAYSQLPAEKDCKLYESVRNKTERPYRCWPLQRVRSYQTHINGNNRAPLAMEQIAALENVVQKPIVQISGAGGVGKSEIIVQICSQYPAEQVMCVGFTGKVASDLEQRSGHKASTIHAAMFRHARFLEAQFRVAAYRKNRRADRAANNKQAAETFSRAHVRQCTDYDEIRAYVEHQINALPPLESPFEHVRVLIVDEDSLLSFPLFLRLLEIAHAPERGRFLEKLILIGDIDQLPPIEFGCVLSDLAHGLPDSVAQLVVNHRSSGTDLFSLSRAVATHKFDLPQLPLFERAGAFDQLERPECAVVAMESDKARIETDIEMILDALGATDITKPCVADIQCIASTGKYVDAINTAVRKSYHIQPALLDFREKLQAKATGGAVKKMVTNEEQTRIAADIDNKVAREEELLNKNIGMRLMVGDRFYVKKNQRRTFKPTRHCPVWREVPFYNGRLLRAICFYDAPKKMTARLRCRCGLCEPVIDEDTGKALPGTCMERLDVAPALRCVPATDNGLRWHDQNIAAVQRHDNKRRMLVAQDEQGTFVELDVGAQLVSRSRFDFGFAMTVHKYQGSQAPIIVYVCVEDTPFVNWKTVYTALGRARCRVVVVSDPIIFDRCVRRKAPLRRSTMWLHLRAVFGCQELGVWPQPLVGDAESEKRAWSEFEDLRISVSEREASEQEAHNQRLREAVEQQEEDDSEDEHETKKRRTSEEDNFQ